MKDGRRACERETFLRTREVAVLHTRGGVGVGASVGELSPDRFPRGIGNHQLRGQMGKGVGV